MSSNSTLEIELNEIRQLISDVITDIKIENENEIYKIIFIIKSSLQLSVTVQNAKKYELQHFQLLFDPKNIKQERLDKLNTFLSGILAEFNDIIKINDQLVLKKIVQKLDSDIQLDQYLAETLSILEMQSKLPHSDSVTQKPEQTKKKNKNIKQASKTESSTPSSNQKLKGADFIFQRFKWDESVDKSQVIIGYLDRFKGILEIKLNDFKNVHDDYRDGIPLHRIRYFKINDEIVWDREKRIDLLTSSGDISKFFKQNTQNTNDNCEDESNSNSIERIQTGEILKFENETWNNGK
jgi:uncharacterized protein (UPF0248 family)